MKRLVVPAVLACAALAACTSNSADPTPSASTSAASTASSSSAGPESPETSLTPPVSMTPSSSSSATATGAKPVSRDGLGLVTLPAVKITTSRGPAAMDKMGVAGYYVEFCPVGAALPVDPAQFTLTSADGAQKMKLVSSGGYAPALAAATVPAGDCAKGYVTFDLSTAQSDAYLLAWTTATARAEWRLSG